MESLAHDIAAEVLDRIVGHWGLDEIGDPYRTLEARMGPEPTPCGQARVFAGGPIHKLVTISLSVEPIGLDSHMLFAFTAPDSAVPHFTLDSVLAGPHFAFHCDLIPRVDLGANLDHLNEAFQPLSDEFAKVAEVEGLTPAHLSPRQYALMSPWMLAWRATEDAFETVRPSIHAYIDHWTGLVDNGLSAPTMGDPAARDRANRAALFNKDVDPVWDQVEELVGADVGEELRQLLIEQDPPTGA